MAKYIDADLLITHINRRIKEHNKSIRQNKRTTKSDIVDAMLVSGRDTYEALLHFIKKNQQEQPEVELPDKRIQYESIDSGIKAFAETYSFNIESRLFPSLTKEQQALWRKEIEEAVVNGGSMGVELARDMRYKENHSKVDLEKEIDSEWAKCEPVDEGMGLESANIVNEQFDSIARHFFELGLKAGKEE